jgi:membrane-bound serine protease (ClpP class)
LRCYYKDAMKKSAILLSLLLLITPLIFSQPSQDTVYIIPVKGIIDLGLSGFIKRALNEAKENNAKIIILEIDTFGGRADAAVEIADSLEKVKPITTVAFVDDQAWSAGALIALACEKIIMSTGSSIGSAEPRALSFNTRDELADEKTISAIRAKFKSLAEENNHPLNLALAMVDKDFELKQVKIKDEIKILTSQELEEIKAKSKEKEIEIIKTINPKGKLLNLTAREAEELGLAEKVLASRGLVLNYLNIKKPEIKEGKPNWSERLVRFLTHPIVSPLLLTLGFLGIFYELQIPGWGLSGTLGMIFLGLFFWGHYLVGLASWTEVIIFFIGILLLLLEILVIPGFGITGISGIVLILLGIYLSLIKHPLGVGKTQITAALSTLSLSIILTFVTVLLTWKFLPKTGLWKRIILDFSETKRAGFQPTASFEQYLGKSGRSLTVLRPTGKVLIEGNTLDVITEGEFIDKDKEIKVVKVEGNKIIVKESTI